MSFENEQWKICHSNDNHRKMFCFFLVLCWYLWAIGSYRPLTFYEILLQTIFLVTQSRHVHIHKEQLPPGPKTIWDAPLKSNSIWPQKILVGQGLQSYTQRQMILLTWLISTITVAKLGGTNANVTKNKPSIIWIDESYWNVAKSKITLTSHKCLGISITDNSMICSTACYG